jgi:peptidoglycan/LPS O-acetylase OafA/YrhL
MLVTVFFAISGMVLYHNYSYIHSFKSFYFKRWKSIFPAYYLCFLFFFTRNVIKMKKVFYKGNKISLLFTLFGMDGYFDYLMKTYYLIGQWFLGAIIIIYLLYPLILYIFKKNIIILPSLLIIIYIWFINSFEIRIYRNIVYCLLRFYFGMIAIKFSLEKKYYIGALSTIVHILFLIFEIPKFKYIIFIYMIQGFALYLMLIHIGNYIMTTKAGFIFKEISKLSYFIYLFHYRIIIDFKGLIIANNWSSPITNIVSIILVTIISAKILFIIVNSLFQWYYFKKLESLFL